MDAPYGNSLLCSSIEICQADENPSVIHTRTCPTGGTTDFMLTNYNSEGGLQTWWAPV